MLRRMTTYTALAVALTLPLTACDDAGTSADDEGRVDLLLTDAPGDIKSAIVTITQVYFQGNAADDASSRIFLVGSATADANVQADLVKLSNDVKELANDEPVPAGSYSQLRVVVSGGCIVVTENNQDKVFATSGYTACGAATGELRMPSASQSGFKVNFTGGAFVVEEGTTEQLLVDFDVSQSFGKAAGSSNAWVMSPVIKGANAQLSGSAAVNVSLASGLTLPGSAALTGFKVRLTNSEGSVEEQALTAGASGGATATFRFLMPGTYTVSLVAPAGIATFVTSPVLPGTVTVNSAATATSNITLTSAS